MVENSTNFGKEKTDNSPESKEKTFLQKIYEFFFTSLIRIKDILQKIINWNIYDWILFFDFFGMCIYIVD